MNKIQRYLYTHGISRDIADEYGLVISENKISIPIKDEEGTILYYKHRHFTGNAKYSYDKGGTARLFGVDKYDGQPLIVLCEGEFDTMAFNSLYKGSKDKVIAISSTGGVNTIGKEMIRYLKEKAQVVGICFDNDDPGRKGAVLAYLGLKNKGINTFIIDLNNFDEYGVNDVSDYAHKVRIDAIDFETKDLLRFSVPFMDKIDHTFVTDTHKGSKVSKIRKSLKIMEGGRYMWSESIYYRLVFELLIKELSKAHSSLMLSSKKAPPKDDGTLKTIKQIPVTNFLEVDSQNKAICPFHNDTNPSLYVNVDESTSFYNTVKCFSCGKFGSVIDVVMAQRNMSFKKALHYLKDNYLKI